MSGKKLGAGFCLRQKDSADRLPVFQCLEYDGRGFSEVEVIRAAMIDFGLKVEDAKEIVLPQPTVSEVIRAHLPSFNEERVGSGLRCLFSDRVKR